MKDSSVQKLIDSINKYAVDPEAEDFWMKTVDCRQYNITGMGVFSQTADRNKYVYNKFMSDEDLQSGYEKHYSEYKQWLTDQKLLGTKYDTTLEAIVEDGWRSYLVRHYYNAIFEIGAIPAGGILSICDYIIIVESMDGAIYKTDLEQCLRSDYRVSSAAIKASKIPEDKYQSAMSYLYGGYLKNALKAVEAENKKRKNQSPLKVLWESQLHNYQLKNTSLGGVDAKPVIGPNGAIRRSLPETQWKWQKTLNAIGDMITTWPDHIIDPDTKEYGKIEEAFSQYNEEMGYADIAEFLDAYGFSVKK